MHKIQIFRPLQVLAALVVLSSSVSWGQILLEDPTQSQTYTPQTGKSAASEYFKRRKTVASTEVEPTRQLTQVGGSDRVMSVMVGSFINDKAYRWGRKDRDKDAGEMMFGVTYRVGEWTASMDLNFRAELMTYSVDGETPLKLSVMPVITFPDARSDFPLYFGAGAGVGIFFDQVADESDLSLDYAIVIGGRFMELWDGGGLCVETGVKGHIHLLSSGQQDGVFLSVGGIFTF